VNPADLGANPAERGTKPGAKPAERGAKLEERGAKLAERGAKLAERGTEPVFLTPLNAVGRTVPPPVRRALLEAIVERAAIPVRPADDALATELCEPAAAQGPPCPDHVPLCAKLLPSW